MRARKVSVEQVAQAVKMREQGMPYPDIAKALGLDVTRKTLQMAVSRAKLKKYKSVKKPKIKEKPVKRVCLKCDRGFDSYGGNRLCNNCHQTNKAIHDTFSMTGAW